MDCAPLFVVNAEDLGEALSLVSMYAFLMAMLGLATAMVLREVGRALWRAYRLHRCKRPFSQRVADAERLRCRLFLAWERLAARRARESARLA